MPQFARRSSAFAEEISEERIGLADADHVFVTVYAGGADRTAKFQANPLWQRLKAVQAGRVYEVKNESWMTSVSVQGAHFVLDDMAKTFGVDAAR